MRDILGSFLIIVGVLSLSLAAWYATIVLLVVAIVLMGLGTITLENYHA